MMTASRAQRAAQNGSRQPPMGLIRRHDSPRFSGVGLTPAPARRGATPEPTMPLRAAGRPFDRAARLRLRGIRRLVLGVEIDAEIDPARRAAGIGLGIRAALAAEFLVIDAGHQGDVTVGTAALVGQQVVARDLDIQGRSRSANRGRSCRRGSAAAQAGASAAPARRDGARAAAALHCPVGRAKWDASW